MSLKEPGACPLPHGRELLAEPWTTARGVGGSYERDSFQFNCAPSPSALAESSCKRNRAHEEDHADECADGAFLGQVLGLSIPVNRKARNADRCANDGQRTPPSGNPRGQSNGNGTGERYDSGHDVESQHECVESVTREGAAQKPKASSPFLERAWYEKSKWDVCESMTANDKGNQIPQPRCHLHSPFPLGPKSGLRHRPCLPRSPGFWKRLCLPWGGRDFTIVTGLEEDAVGTCSTAATTSAETSTWAGPVLSGALLRPSGPVAAA